MTFPFEKYSIYYMKQKQMDYTSFRIQKNILKRIKVESVKADMSIKDFLIFLLESYLKKNRI